MFLRRRFRRGKKARETVDEEADKEKEPDEHGHLLHDAEVSGTKDFKDSIEDQKTRRRAARTR